LGIKDVEENPFSWNEGILNFVEIRVRVSVPIGYFSLRLSCFLAAKDYSRWFALGAFERSSQPFLLAARLLPLGSNQIAHSLSLSALSYRPTASPPTEIRDAPA